jgi:NAD(P)-dependent dehydrogenase (short-subunit alcohol dehydrogenase family)
MHVAGRHPQPDSDSSGGSSSRPRDGQFWPILPVWPYMYRCTRSRVHNKSVRCTAVIVMMDISFSSVFALCQYAYPLLKSGGRGKILTIGSEYSLHGAARMVNYASSKHAVIGMTKSLAVGWAKDNIQVNCVIPGWIHTDLAGPAIDREPTGSAIKAKTPNPRGFGLPEDMAGLTILLASRASDFVTGKSIPVDGGFAISIAPRAGL